MSKVQYQAHILLYKGVIYFAPYILNERGAMSFSVPFESVGCEADNYMVGTKVLSALASAKLVDISTPTIKNAIEDQLQIKTWSSVVKKCLHSFVIQDMDVPTVKIHRAYGNKGGLFEEEMYQTPLDDPEDIGKKVLEALYYYKKVVSTSPKNPTLHIKNI